MPYHGLALDGEFVAAAGTEYEQQLAVSGAGACTVVRHPAATGIYRNPIEAADDAARGFEWRNYALLCGSQRAFNGGPELGGNAWLYCDPAGPTWLMRLQREVIDSVPDQTQSKVRFKVLRASLFGWFGRQSPEAEVVATFDWQPQFPEWYTAGTYEPWELVPFIASYNPELSIVPSSDGSKVIINVLSVHQAINAAVFPETMVELATGTNIALVGLIEVDLSGSPDLDTGAGLVTTFSKTHDYPDLVLSRDKEVFDDGGLVSYEDDGSYQTAYDVFGAPTSEDAANGRTEVITSHVQPVTSDREYYEDRHTANWRAIVYRRPEGDVIVDRVVQSNEAFQFSAGGEMVIEETWEAVFGAGGPEWTSQGHTCNSSVYKKRTDSIDKRSNYSFEFFGTGVVELTVEQVGTIQERIDYIDLHATSAPPGCHPEPTPVYNYFDVPVLVNGVEVASAFADVDAEAVLKLLHSSGFHCRTDYLNANGVTHTQREVIHAAGDGQVQKVLDETSNWTGFPPFPKHYCSWQPVTGEARVETADITGQVPQFF